MQGLLVYHAASLELLRSGSGLGGSDLAAAPCDAMVAAVVVVTMVLRWWTAATARGWCVPGRGASWDPAACIGFSPVFRQLTRQFSSP